MRRAAVLLVAVACASPAPRPALPASVAVAVDAGPAPEEPDASDDLATLKAEAERWKRSGAVDGDAAEAFLRYAEALGVDDDEYPRLTFLAANVYRRMDDLEAAERLYAWLVQNYPAHEVALYAANLLLDGLNRDERFDELVAWAEEMRASPALLEGRDDLQDVVDNIHVQSQRKAAEAQEQAGDPAGCAQTLLAIHAELPDGLDDDELLYDAMRCAHEAGDDAGVDAIVKALATEHPKAEVTKRARELRKAWRRTP